MALVLTARSRSKYYCTRSTLLQTALYVVVVLFVAIAFAVDTFFLNDDGLDALVVYSDIHTKVQTPAATLSCLNKQQQLCTRSQIRNGTWKPSPHSPVQKPPYFVAVDTARCYHTKIINSTYGETYDWIPNDAGCTLEEWSMTSFCRVLTESLPNITTILFVGDSIMREQYMSLVSLWGWYGNKDSIFKKGEYTICSRRFTGNATDNPNAPLRVVHYPDSVRPIRVIYQNDYTLDNLGRLSVGWLPTYKPQLVILNRGIHYVANNTEYEFQITKKIRALERWYYNSTTCAPGTIGSCLAIWKTSVPGHPQCGSYAEPRNNIADMERFIANASLYGGGPNTTTRYEKFGWWAQKHQNQLLERLFSQENNSLLHPFLELMDAYELQITRPDVHRTDQGDCLHNCLPSKGKQEVLNQILLHILQLKATQQIYDEKAM